MRAGLGQLAVILGAALLMAVYLLGYWEGARADAQVWRDARSVNPAYTADDLPASPGISKHTQGDAE